MYKGIGKAVATLPVVLAAIAVTFVTMVRGVLNAVVLGDLG
jgi:hypothetical protein